ncbi:MAG: excinuclease ABC subunit UvrA [Chloroflexi bacterium]|nr:excinuclease ABC subunit UvrA [Chloroflexota bacterium]MCH8816494.1 excinuclease ABC subunit UvrA [Chloroflexota bacterium]
MAEEFIRVRGAREHNLRNIDVDVPRDKLVVITGVSGSGKSSLAFDTIYAEGQRRYVESLSAYARQFLGRMDKPDVDHIDGLSPAISIDQKGVSRNPRSTVGTVTEVYDYLRLLFARAGRPHCHNCGRPVARQSVQQITDSVMRLEAGARILVLAPIITHKKGEHLAVFENASTEGFVRVRVDGDVRLLEEEIKLARTRWHDIEIVVDRLVTGPDAEVGRLSDSIETALRLAGGTVIISIIDGEDIVYSEKFACVHCDLSIGELEPRNFSFNTPYGACPTCTGLGFRLEVDPDLVVPAQNLSIRNGAIEPWSRNGELLPERLSVMEAVSDHYDFSLDVPFRELTEREQNIVLYGDGDRRIEVLHTTQSGRTYRWRMRNEGVIPHLERRHENTESQNVRDEVGRYMAQLPCVTCSGYRLKPETLAVTVLGMNIIQVTQQSVERALHWVEAARTGRWPDAHGNPSGNASGNPGGESGEVNEPLSQREHTIAEQILKEIESRLSFLERVGLEYLTLDRTASTLSGGEGQRIRLATQIGSGLMGVLYVCDEPSIGLHPLDDHRLIKTLQQLRDVGNTVIVVEHDEAVMRASDHIIDLGPGAGEHGGYVVAEGDISVIEAAEDSLTGAYLSGRKTIPIPEQRRPGDGTCIEIRGAAENNLKDIDVKIPLGELVCITGVSGSGKSSLINEILQKKLAQTFYRAKDRPGKHEEIAGLDNVDKVVNIDHTAIGRTPRSNPATYTGAYTPIRDLFSTMPEARARGYKPGRFSFNVKGGRCESCSGAGYVQISMQFLPDVTVPCEVCEGARYNREALEIKFKGASIADVLDMTITEACVLFENIPPVMNRLRTLVEVGLGYMRLGQPATTLSGGEAQRVKLATELSKTATGKTVYILDEPTTGLSFEDCAVLMRVLHRLVDAGNTVILIEHHLDLIKNADWIIDLGPGAGERGGELVAQGTPEYIASVSASHTGRYLAEVPGIHADASAPGSAGPARRRRRAAVSVAEASPSLSGLSRSNGSNGTRSLAPDPTAGRERRRRRRRRRRVAG